MSEEERTDRPCGCGGAGHDHRGGHALTASDPGSKSLADALRVSFMLLAAIMVFMVAGFLLTGLQSIESNEVGIVKVFGKVVRTAGPGLTYNWPFPIGQIETVKTDEQHLTIRDFWMNEAPDEVAKRLSQRRSPGEGLRPGWDGALLTGDRYLIHVKIDCQYAVADAKAFRRWVRDAYTERLPYDNHTREIDPKVELMRSAVCSAAIMTAATATADGLQTGGASEFQRDAMLRANRILLGEDPGGAPSPRPGDSTGLRIRSLLVTQITWPLRAREDYLAVQAAAHAAGERKNRARSEAERILRAAAGTAYEKLVGRPWGTPGQDGPDGKAKQPYDLIGQYTALRAEARNASDQGEAARLEARAEKVLKQIDEVLLTGGIQGDASQIMEQASTYKTRIEQRVEARANEFERLLPEYEKAPEFTVARLWAEAREEILAAAVEKYYISTAKGLTVLKINRDPAMAKSELRRKLEAALKAHQDK